MLVVSMYLKYLLGEVCAIILGECVPFASTPQYIYKLAFGGRTVQVNVIFGVGIVLSLHTRIYDCANCISVASVQWIWIIIPVDSKKNRHSKALSIENKKGIGIPTLVQSCMRWHVRFDP
jgi:hypothetical protein